MCYEKYIFKSKLLKNLIGSHLYFGENKSAEMYIPGWTCGKRTGATILMYLYKNAFNFHRFPMYEDRHFTEKVFTMENNEEKLTEFFKDETFLKEHDNMIEELKEIYSHTQNCLDIDYPKQNYIDLSRGLHGEYASILLQLKESAIEKNEKTVKIGADILNSFSSSLGAYGDECCVFMQISKEDILCYAESIDDVMEGFEFIVINRARDGLIEIPVDKIRKSLDKRSRSIEKKWHLHKRAESPYFFVNFAMNTKINFDKQKKARSLVKSNTICKLLKKANKCCEVY